MLKIIRKSNIYEKRNISKETITQIDQEETKMDKHFYSQTEQNNYLNHEENQNSFSLTRTCGKWMSNSFLIQDSIDEFNLTSVMAPNTDKKKYKILSEDETPSRALKKASADINKI